MGAIAARSPHACFTIASLFPHLLDFVLQVTDGLLELLHHFLERCQPLLDLPVPVCFNPWSPALPVYLDSPLAIEATEIYARHGAYHMPARYRFARTPAESKALNDLTGPLIIISASGMATGGRILHHLAQRLPDERTTVLLVGYLSAGTRARLLEDGAREVKMLGRMIPVRARIEKLDALSAHADRDEILRWLEGFERPPRVTYLVHGEASAASALRDAIRQRFGWNVQVAVDGVSVSLKKLA